METIEAYAPHIIQVIFTVFFSVLGMSVVFWKNQAVFKAQISGEIKGLKESDKVLHKRVDLTQSGINTIEDKYVSTQTCEAARSNNNQLN